MPANRPLQRLTKEHGRQRRTNGWEGVCVSNNWTKGFMDLLVIHHPVWQSFSRLTFSLHWFLLLFWPGSVPTELYGNTCVLRPSQQKLHNVNTFKLKIRLHLRYVCSFYSKHLFNIRLSSEQMASGGLVRHLAPPLTSAGYLRDMSHSFVLPQWKRRCVMLDRDG